MKNLILLLCIVSTFAAKAQQGFVLKGKVTNANNEVQQGLPVMVYYFKGDDTLYASTNKRGNFEIKGVSNSSFYVNVQGIGLQTFNKFYDLQVQNSEVLLPTIAMQVANKSISGVTITGKQAIQVKEDTLSFNADSFKTRGDLPAEELLKKLPGVSVDKDGNVTAQGKQVTAVKVNGKEFFGGDVKNATREIPVEMIDKVQVIDDYGDQANFTGNRDGDPNKIINFQLRKDKNQGYFGNANIGYGTQNRYTAGIGINQFKEAKQISANINANNINKENFNFSSPSGGRMSGGPNAMGRNQGGDASTLNQNGGSGITNLLSGGINYRNDISKKITHYGSLVVSNKNTQTLTQNYAQTFFENVSNTNLQNIQDTNKGVNYRVSYNLEYKMDSNNFFKISPQFSLRNNNTNSNTDFNIQDSLVKASSGLQQFKSKVASPFYGATILWNHKFAKAGRTLSITSNGNYTTSNQLENYINSSTFYNSVIDSLLLLSAQEIDILNATKSFGTGITYTEPINVKHSLEFNYNYNNSILQNNRQTAVQTANNIFVPNDTLSNNFENKYITHKLGANWRYTHKLYNFSMGLAAQPANISTHNFTQKFIISNNVLNIFPTARFSYKFSKGKNLEITYNGRTNQPSAMQLQPVTDRSNRQFITIGNPNLRPEFSSTFRIRYNNFNAKTGVSIFANARYEFTNDKITSNTRRLPQGIQETQYVNANGNNSIATFYNIAKPFSNRKYTLKLNGHAMYNNSLALANNIKNYGKRIYTYQNIMLDINAKDWVSFSAGFGHSLNNNKYSLNPNLNASTNTYMLQSEATFFLPKNFRINYSLSKNYNTGFAQNVIANPFIINGYVEKQFGKSKKASLRLTAYDVLKQNTSIQRNINGNTITDAQDNRLTQYFLLVFNYKISKFVGKQPNAPEGDRPHGRPDGGRGSWRQ